MSKEEETKCTYPNCQCTAFCTNYKSNTDLLHKISQTLENNGISLLDFSNGFNDSIIQSMAEIHNSRQSEMDELTKERDDWKKECGLRLIELTKMEINCKLKKNKLTDNLKKLKALHYSETTRADVLQDENEKLKAEVEELKINNHKMLLDFYKELKEFGRLYSDNTSEELMMNDISEFLKLD